MKRSVNHYARNGKYRAKRDGGTLFSDEQIQEGEAKYQLVFQHAPIGLMHFDKDGVITSCNEAFVEIMGSSYEELIGIEMAKLPDKRVVKLLKNALNGKYGNLEGMYTSVSGKKPIYGKLNLQPIINSDGQVMGGVGILEDITERTEYELRLEYLSQSDPVTGLFNRSYFEQYLDSVSINLFNEHVAIIVCDIDDLKLINDTMGHSAGDQLLLSAARILKRSSPAESVVARIGGDEFAILIPFCNRDMVKTFEENLENNIVRHNSHHPDLPVSLSYGYALSDKNLTDMKVLFREADLCMYREKIQHRRNARRSIVQSFLKSSQSLAYLREEKIVRLKEYMKIFCEKLDISKIAFNYLMGLVEYHDIGKVGLENSPVFKQFYNYDESILEIQKHCEIGYRIAISSEDIAILANAILKHHEFWNGKGYPLGIKGQEIPLECRIFSIVNVYDEMVNGESGSQCSGREEVIQTLRSMAGEELDPELTAIFIDLVKEKIIG